MEKTSLNDGIIDFLQNSSSPMTLESIAEEFKITEFRARRSLDELVCGKKIIKIIPKNKASGRIYYTIVHQKAKEDGGTSTASEKNAIQDSIIQETVNVKDNYEDLSEKIEVIDTNVNGIYANIISIMSIFVCIFALITVNANISFELTQENTNDVFKGIVIVNIFVVVCVIVLLIGVKQILINPLTGKKKKASDYIAKFKEK